MSPDYRLFRLCKFKHIVDTVINDLSGDVMNVYRLRDHADRY